MNKSDIYHLRTQIREWFDIKGYRDIILGLLLIIAVRAYFLFSTGNLDVMTFVKAPFASSSFQLFATSGPAIDGNPLGGVSTLPQIIYEMMDSFTWLTAAVAILMAVVYFGKNGYDYGLRRIRSR